MNNTKLTLGSLFDGSGGFPLSGILTGIEPKWSSEIAPFPTLVTHRRLPQVKHYGDVSELSGAEIEPVDIITFGSPCQDLSIAGKRAGIHDGERSSLFFQAICIIKEMRDATNGRYPRYAVWENVCFTEDTLITCENGYKRIKDVSVGERVKTHTGKFMPVVKVHQNKKKQVLKIKVSGAEDTLVTPNHPFLTIQKIYSSKRIVGTTQPEWNTAENLTNKHLIGYRIDTPTLPEDFITESEAWAVGRWIADGSVDLTKSNPRMFFSIGIGKEIDARKHLNMLPYTVYENKPYLTATNFCFTSHEFYTLISDAGIGAGNKRMPSYVFHLPFRLQKAVLEGYLSGDGYIRQRGNCVELAASTASRELSYGVARLIRNVYRVAANISVHPAKSGQINGREIHANYLCYRIEASLTSKVTLSVIDEDIIWQPVKSIETVKEKKTVYNLSVLGDNTYAANDIIVHNCGAFSSNNGEDFRTVLEELCKIKVPAVSVPKPKKWTKAGEILGDSFSLSWRTFDAQYWGVPQRRARIYLVADFAGESAGEVLFKSEGLSGYTPQGFRAWQGTSGGSEESTGASGERSDNGSGVLCVNTQGNSGVGITEDKALALVAQDHGNQPAVLHAAGFSTEHSAKARSIGYEEEISPTLRAGVVPAALSVENHPTDGRVKIREDGKCQTLCSRAGTGGNNVPLVAEPEIRAFGVCSKHSNAMLSNNPNSGFYEADTAKTIDTSNQSPCKNQGGIAVVALEPGAASRVGGHIYRDGKSGTLRANAGDNQQAVVMPETYSLQGSMIGRSDKNGPQGNGISEGISFCLNTVDHHAVATPETSYTISRDNHFAVSEDVSVTAVAREPATVATPDADHYSTSKNSHHTVAAHEQANTLVASDWKDPPLVNDLPNDEPAYIVHRLTPVECARLQGFPDWWCADLADENPSDEEIAFWTEVWETWRQVTNPNGKPKTEKQIRKWLANPYTDSAEYALWGNDVALPCPYFVLLGIVWATQNSETLAANCEQTDTKPDD